MKLGSKVSLSILIGYKNKPSEERRPTMLPPLSTSNTPISLELTFHPLINLPGV